MIVCSMAFLDSFLTFMERGGMLMWPLLFLSVVACAVSIERAVFWSRVHGSRGLQRLSMLTVALRKGDREQASVLLRNDPSPYGRLAREILDADGDETLAVAAAEEIRPTLRTWVGDPVHSCDRRSDVGHPRYCRWHHSEL